jgi:hypothetical protein
MSTFDQIDAAIAELDRRLISVFAAYLKFIRLHVHTWRYS